MKQHFTWNISRQIFWFPTLLLLNIFFVVFRFFPTIRDIGLWDDAGYINRGRELVQGVLPRFSDNPATALLFGFSYLPFQHDHFWMIHTATVGRILLFILVWSASYLIAKQVPGLKWYVMVGLMFVSTIMVDIIENPSDTLFAGLSGLAFWQMLCYINSRQVKHLALVSTFIGLAALARNDGVILFLAFLLISLSYLKSAENKLQHIVAALLPFSLLVGGYILFYGSITGNFDPGIQERSYLAFLQGQTDVSKPDSNCKAGPIKCAADEADRLYGSSAENNNSILRAIAHNPQAYIQRLLNTILVLPRLAHDAYGKNTFYALAFLIMPGIFLLIRTKKYAILALSLAWCIHLGVYFFTFFRAGYLRMPFFILILLASLGVQELVESLGQKRQWVWAAILLVLTCVGVQHSLNYLYFSTLILLACLFFGYWLKTSVPEISDPSLLTLVMFLAGGLIMRGGFTPPVIPTLGMISEEQAILVLEQRFDENTPVAAGAPGIPWEARMKFVTIDDKDFLTANTPEEYYANLKKAGVKAIYVDNIITNNSALWALIKPGIGIYYDQIYSGRSNSILVLVLK